ncbi:MAG: hypothetical protein HYU58_06500 [Proteobacteria bacterium]|nr:hypothetical protein [Pseudomonadota bacterium]
MVNVAQAVSSGASSAALYARASAGAAGLATEPAEAAPAVEAAANLPIEQTVVSIGRAYRYNSFEFSYRQDFGKIVLLRQKPDTGEVVQQFPSEYYLQKYADGQRVARSAAEEHVGNGAGTGQAASTARAAQTAASQPVVSAPAPSPAPSVPSAPALPSAGNGGSASPVNLTV